MNARTTLVVSGAGIIVLATLIGFGVGAQLGFNTATRLVYFSTMAGLLLVAAVLGFLATTFLVKQVREAHEGGRFE